MKILFITQTVDEKDDVLGAVHSWIEALAKQAEEIHVICLYKGSYNLPPNVHIHSLGKEDKVSRFQYTWRFYKYIWKLRKNYEVAFVHMNQIYVLMGGPLWRFLGKKVALWKSHKRTDYISVKIAMRLVHKAFSTSSDSFAYHNSKKFIATGHGIDTDKFSCSEK